MSPFNEAENIEFIGERVIASKRSESIVLVSDNLRMRSMSPIRMITTMPRYGYTDTLMVISMIQFHRIPRNTMTCIGRVPSTTAVSLENRLIILPRGFES